MLLVLLATSVGVIAHAWPPRERVYMTATIVAGLTYHPSAWAGRTLLVQATILDIRQRFPAAPAAHVVMTPPLPAHAPNTITFGARMYQAEMASHGQTLTLLTRPPAGVLMALRQLPVVSRFVAPPQRGNAFGSGVYRVQLAGAAQGCLPLRLRRLSRAALLTKLRLPRWRGCYDGILLDYEP